MKKIFIYILFLILVVSCKEEKNVANKLDKKQITDSISNKTIVSEKVNQDSISSKPVKNILHQKSAQSNYGMKSIAELWQTYKSAKISATKYIKENNLDSIVQYLNIAADAAYDLSREDIATWQLNNIGYYSIKEFKKRTDYENRIQVLDTLTNLKQKGLFLEETKSVFKENYEILSRAGSYLYKAQLLDCELEKSERSEIIDRNIRFVEWVSDFVLDNEEIIKEDK